MNVVLLSVIILSVIMLSIVILNVVMLSVIMLNVVAPIVKISWLLEKLFYFCNHLNVTKRHTKSLYESF